MPGISKSARRRLKAERVKNQKRSIRKQARKIAKNLEGTVVKILKKGEGDEWLVAGSFIWFFNSLKQDEGAYPGDANVRQLVDKINFSVVNGHPLHVDDTMFMEAEVTDIGEIWAKVVKVKGGAQRLK